MIEPSRTPGLGPFASTSSPTGIPAVYMPFARYSMHITMCCESSSYLGCRKSPDIHQSCFPVLIVSTCDKVRLRRRKLHPRSKMRCPSTVRVLDVRSVTSFIADIWARLTLVPHAREMAVAAITETTRAVLLFFSNMLAPMLLPPSGLGKVFQRVGIQEMLGLRLQHGATISMDLELGTGSREQFQSLLCQVRHNVDRVPSTLSPQRWPE